MGCAGMKAKPREVWIVEWLERHAWFPAAVFQTRSKARHLVRQLKINSRDGVYQIRRYRAVDRRT